MKRFCAFLILVAITCCPVMSARAQENVAEEVSLNETAKAYALMDTGTGAMLAEYHSDEKMPSANVAMNMGVLLFLEAMDSGSLKETDSVEVSQNAWRTTGTKVFLDNGASYPAGELLKAVVVTSANDAAIALAEHVYGTQEEFIAALNKRARDLGLENTVFTNALGYDDAGQYTSARDMAVVMREITKYPLYFKWSGIWLDEFTHPSGRTTEMTNFNKLIRFYDGADGGKTGSSSVAGYCIAATAKRGTDRFIYVALGDLNSNTRFDNAKTAFDYAFNNFTSKTPVKAGKVVVRDIPVEKGDVTLIDGVAESDIKLLMTRYDEGKLDKQVTIRENLCAPIAKGEVIGEVVVVCNGREMGRCNVVSPVDVLEMNLGASVGRIIGDWLG